MVNLSFRDQLYHPQKMCAQYRRKKKTKQTKKNTKKNTQKKTNKKKKKKNKKKKKKKQRNVKILCGNQMTSMKRILKLLSIAFTNFNLLWGVINADH